MSRRRTGCRGSLCTGAGRGGTERATRWRRHATDPQRVDGLSAPPREAGHRRRSSGILSAVRLSTCPAIWSRSAVPCSRPSVHGARSRRTLLSRAGKFAGYGAIPSSLLRGVSTLPRGMAAERQASRRNPAHSHHLPQINNGFSLLFCHSLRRCAARVAREWRQTAKLGRASSGPVPQVFAIAGYGGRALILAQSELGHSGDSGRKNRDAKIQSLGGIPADGGLNGTPYRLIIRGPIARLECMPGRGIRPAEWPLASHATLILQGGTRLCRDSSCRYR